MKSREAVPGEYPFDDEYGYCGACETNPHKLEWALEEAIVLPNKWRKLARAMPAESVTAKILRACALELSIALAARCASDPADEWENT